MVRGELSSIERKIIVALITTDVHNRDITEKLAVTEVENISRMTEEEEIRIVGSVKLCLRCNTGMST